VHLGSTDERANGRNDNEMNRMNESKEDAVLKDEVKIWFNFG